MESKQRRCSVFYLIFEELKYLYLIKGLSNSDWMFQNIITEKIIRLDSTGQDE